MEIQRTKLDVERLVREAKRDGKDSFAAAVLRRLRLEQRDAPERMGWLRGDKAE